MNKYSIKKLIASTLILLIIICYIPAFSTSAAQVTEDGFEYTIENKMVTIIEYKGEGSIVTIPSTIESLPVRHLGSRVFDDNQNITEVIIPEGVYTIGESAFIHCTNLEKAIIPHSVVEILDGAFRYCRNLKEVNIPEGVRTIKELAFSNCSALTNITIPDSVTIIETSAFSGCTALKEIIIPDKVTSIDDNAFYACENLRTVTVPHNVTVLGDKVFKDCKNLETITLPENITRIGNDLVKNTAYSNNKDNWNGDALYIDSYLLMSNESLEDEYIIKDGTTLIAAYGFSSCDNINTVIFPDSLRYIGECAFKYCYDLDVLVIPDGTLRISSAAFSCCDSLNEITIPKSVEYIGENAFHNHPGDLTIYGLGNSTAQEYAKLYEIYFSKIDEVKPVLLKGDADFDGELTIKDATTIQKHIAKLIVLDKKSLACADYNKSTDVDIKDATAIQKKLAALI